MAKPSRSWSVLAGLGVAGLLSLAGLAGCGKKPAEGQAEVVVPPRGEKTEQAAPPAPPQPAPPSPSETVQNQSPRGTSGETAEPPMPPAPASDRLHQPFTQAIRETPLPDARPEDTTMTGKSVGKLYVEVTRIWPSIRFVENDRPVNWKAIVETSEGTFEIDLEPAWAPNHVRNFIALARVGYYDGLVFDRIHHEEDPTGKGSPFLSVEGGCPAGTGEAVNSLGYWLKPEFDPGVKHVEGTVGFCRGEEEDTAGCKFYINLSKDASYLDGHFSVIGKVTRGLDVVRKIYARPVIVDDRDIDGSRRPEKPVVIRKVTVEPR